MSNTRYIEIDSTYRNRERFPHPASFDVLISQFGSRNRFRAIDPVSDAAPMEVWIPNDIAVAGGALPPIPPPTADQFLVCWPSGTLVPEAKVNGYYNGVKIEDTGLGEIRCISTWEFISDNGTDECFLVTVDVPFSAVPVGPFDIVQSTNFSIPVVWIPASVSADHAYVGCIIYNQSRNEFRTIVSFDGTTRLAGLDSDASLWVDTDILVLRKSMPIQIGTLVGGSLNTAVIGPNAIDNDFYTGCFIRITSGTNINRICRITGYAYDDLSQEITLTLSCNPLLTVPLAAGDTYEILQCTRDNFVPFNYTGSLVSQQQMVCYEIELINLILPNTIIVSGGRIAFYPYVYVEFQNLSGASAGTNGIIYSNNPNANRMLFRAAVDDIANPELSPFIKIDGDGMVQTVKFKPNDNLKFGVYLPNGELFQTVLPDTYSPEPANPLVQISALFSIKRL